MAGLCYTAATYGMETRCLFTPPSVLLSPLPLPFWIAGMAWLVKHCTVPGCSSFEDNQGHGTHTMGTACGAIHGVARAATIHPVKALGADGSGSYSSVIAGLDW